MADTKRRKQNTPAPEQAVVEAIFRGIGALVMAIFQLLFGKKGGASSGGSAQVKVIREHWEQVELYVLQDATQALAVSEADKLLDAAFQAKGVRGETMGERLKAAQSKFPSDLYQQIWDAHKLRNNLAHQVGAQVSGEQARQAVSAFRQALYQLGVLS